MSANIANYYGQTIQWDTELKYLGIDSVCSRGFKCSLTAAKRSLYRAGNAVFGKIGGISSEVLILLMLLLIVLLQLLLSTNTNTTAVLVVNVCLPYFMD